MYTILGNKSYAPPELLSMKTISYVPETIHLFFGSDIAVLNVISALSRIFRPTMDYGQEKGFQDGDSCRRTGGHSSGRFCLLATLLTVSLGISLLALVLATSANLQVRGRGEEKADWIEEPKQARDIPNIDTMKLQKNPVGQVRISLVKFHFLSLLTIEPRISI